jgi:hypothetical protein
MGSRLAHPRQHGIRIHLKHSGHGPNAQAFSHSGDRLYDTVGRSELPIQGRAVRFEEIGVTDYAVELAPGPSTRMAVRPDIALPDPAVIGARGRGTVLAMVVDRSRPSFLVSEQGRRGKRWLVKGLLTLLTGCAGGLLGQASKGLGRRWRSLGLLSWQAYRFWPRRQRT